MCMLTFLPPNVLPNVDRLRNGTISNRDGHGWAIVVLGDDGRGSHILTGHSMNAEAAIDAFRSTREKHPEGPALFHSRYTTGGLVNESNCHPYVVTGDPRTVLAHNGVLSGVATQQPFGDKRSDTRYFAEEFGHLLYPGSNPGVDFNLNSKRGRRRLSRWLGSPNKFVILTTDPTFRRSHFIVNADQGIWEDDGCWYSNSGYRERTFGIGTRYVGSGWGWAGTDWEGYGWDNDRPMYATSGREGTVWERLARASDGSRVFVDKGAREPAAPGTADSCEICGARSSMDLELMYCRICGTCADCFGDALDEYSEHSCDCAYPTGRHPGRQYSLNRAFGIDSVIAEMRASDLGADDSDTPDDAAQGASARQDVDTGWPVTLGPPARRLALPAAPEGPEVTGR